MHSLFIPYFIYPAVHNDGLEDELFTLKGTIPVIIIGEIRFMSTSLYTE